MQAAAQLAELGGREVGRDVDRRRAELLQRVRGRGVGAWEEDRGLEDERRGQLADAPHTAERLEHPEIGDEERADAEGDAAPHL